METSYMNGFNDYLDGADYNPPLSPNEFAGYVDGWQDGIAYLASEAEKFQNEYSYFEV